MKKLGLLAASMAAFLALTVGGNAAPSANTLYLSPNGNDAGSCTQAAPCRSFARAYAVAQSGDTVEVQAGSYPSQFFAGGYLSSQARGTKAVTFHGQPGNKVRQISFGSPNLVFDGINQDAGLATVPNDAPGFANGGEPFVFKNGSIGNIVDQKGALVDGAGMVFDNVLFHDVVIRTSGVHSECIFAAVPEGMVVRDSEFVNCAVMDIFFVWPEWWGNPPAYGNVVLEGNSFGDPVGSCCGIYIGGTGGPASNKDRTMRGWVVKNNFFGDPPAVAGADAASVFCGNTGSAPAAWKVACAGTPPPPPPAKQCADSVDNDADGKVDLADPGCVDAADDSESPDPTPPPPPPSCDAACEQAYKDQIAALQEDKQALQASLDAERAKSAGLQQRIDAAKAALG